MTSTLPPFDDIAPVSDELTKYDRAHIKLYMRLLDAADDGAEWTEAVNVLFGIDPVRNPSAPGKSMTAIWHGRAG